MNNYYTINNSTDLANNLTKLKINDNHRLITLDIKDLYVNIPIDETIHTTRTQLLKHNDLQTTNQICNILETILRQNYFTFQDRCYQPEKGVAMGSPLSGTMAEIFLQHLENFHIKPLLDSKRISLYSRYVDDILIIYDATRTNPETIVHHANSMHSNIRLSPTLETNNQISFLDLLIIRKSQRLEIDIYRKPTTTDTTINYLSNHPMEQKLAAYRYHIERMLRLPLNRTRQLREWKTILHMATSNNFPTTLLQKLKQQIQHKITTPPTTKNTENNTKWATFTFSSPHIRKITNLFRHTNVKISYKCSNTVTQLTKPTANRNIPPHDKSGVYCLTCKTCNLSYVGQTSRNLKTRFQEHIRYIKTNNPQSAYAQHILQNRHEYGTLAETMALLKPIQQESMLLPSEQFHIQSLHQAGKLIPEQSLNDPNPLFQLTFSHPHHTRHKTEPVNQHPANRTHNPQLHTRPAT